VGPNAAVSPALPAGPLADVSPVLAGLVGASVEGRVALDPRAGACVRRLGDEPDLGHVISRGPRQAQVDACDLHAKVWIPPPNNRARLEQLCRYLLRPSLAQDRIRLRSDGRVLVKLKTVWRDGTSHFHFEPIEFLEKLAALIPRPAVNLLLYHGVLAPRARWRSQVVRYGRPTPDGNALEASPRAAVLTRAWTWAALMHRVFALACPRCGGRLRVIATVQGPLAVQAILAHLRRSGAPEPPGPAPSASAAIG
jgi:hypothetical protein